MPPKQLVVFNMLYYLVLFNTPVANWDVLWKCFSTPSVWLYNEGSARKGIFANGTKVSL